MTEAMPFLQKAILLSYDPRPFGRGCSLIEAVQPCSGIIPGILLVTQVQKFIRN